MSRWLSNSCGASRSNPAKHRVVEVLVAVERLSRRGDESARPQLSRNGQVFFDTS